MHYKFMRNLNSRLLILLRCQIKFMLKFGAFINCISDEGFNVEMFMIVSRFQIKLA